MEKGPVPLAPGYDSSAMVDEPVLAVYEAKGGVEVQWGVWTVGIVISLFAIAATVLAFVGEILMAFGLVIMGLAMQYPLLMSRRIRDTNARLSYNSCQFIAEKTGRTEVHDLKQLRVINRVKGQDYDSNSCIFKIEFKDGTAYWVYGEDDANAFVTELRRVAGVRII